MPGGYYLYGPRRTGNGKNEECKDGSASNWKVAVITGGTSGIGEATAELFAAEGYPGDHRGPLPRRGTALADRLGDNVVYEHQDVTVEADVRRVTDAAVDRFGCLDVLFNNAGGPTAGNVTDIAAQNVDYGVKLLFTSVVLGMRYAVPPHACRRRRLDHQQLEHRGAPPPAGEHPLLRRQGRHHALFETRRRGTRAARHPCQRDLASGHRNAHFLGRVRARQHAAGCENARKMAKLQGNLAKANPLKKSGLAWDIATAALFLASNEGRFVASGFEPTTTTPPV